MGACMTPPNLCFVMELCETSLYNILHVNREDFTERDAIQCAIDVGSAIEYLHAQKPVIIHRDIKSHNILRALNGAMKLCDFGLVNSKVTQAGTPCYMAPELLDNKTFNKSVDSYAFGVLLGELHTKEIPFNMINVMDIRDRVINGDRPRAPTFGCSPRMIKLIKECWAQDSADRPDFTTIVDELIEVSDSIQEYKATEGLGGGGDALDGLLAK